MPSCPLTRAFSIQTILSAFDIVRETDFYFKGELHDFWEVVFVADGQIAVTENDRMYEMERGDIIFHRPMEFHKIWARGKKKPRSVIFSFKTEGEVPDAIGDGVMHLNAVDEAVFMNVFHQAHMLRHQSDMRTDTACQLFTASLENFIFHLASTAQTEDRALHSLDAQRYKAIIAAMQAHIDENLSVDDIARLSGMTTGTMKAVFAKFSDGGVKTHFNRLKIASSVELLKAGLPILEISERLSYSSQNYFSMVFKNETGYAPLCYRQKFL